MVREQALALFGKGLEQANEFLASEHRLSLPVARYELEPDGGLVFVTESKRWPIRIRNSLSGDLVIFFGFRAQERDDGFVVGARPPDEFPAIDNSLFRLPDGEWQTVESVAKLILHETAHTVHGEGTVGYWNTFCYYLEAVFLLRSTNHSAEIIPRAIGKEFLLHRWIQEAEASGNEPMFEAYAKMFEQHRAGLLGGTP